VKIRVIRRIGRRLWVVIKHQSTSMNRNLASRVWCSFNARWRRRRKLTGQRSCEQYQLYRVDGVGLMVFQGVRINLINMQRKQSRGCQKREAESQPRTMSSSSIGDLWVASMMGLPRFSRKRLTEQEKTLANRKRDSQSSRWDS